MTRSVLFITAIMISATSAAYAEDDDTITEKFLLAKTQFDQSMTQARDALLVQLTKSAASAQQAGDLKKLESVEAEIKAFAESGKLPTAVPTKAYLNSVDACRTQMSRAFATAVKEYTKVGNRDAAKKAQSEFDEFAQSNVSNLQSKFKIGKWVPVFSPGDLLKDWDLKGAEYRYGNGTLELQDSFAIFPLLETKDVAVRVQVKKISGQNLAIKLRSSDKGAYFFFFNGGDFFGLGKSTPSRSYHDLKVVRTQAHHDDFITMVFSVKGNELRGFVNGSLILSVHDDELTSGGVALRAKDGSSLFRDMSIQLLGASAKIDEVP